MTSPDFPGMDRMRRDVDDDYRLQNDAARLRREEPIEAFAQAWGVDRGAAAIALDFEMLLTCRGDAIRADELADLARNVKAYGDNRERTALRQLFEFAGVQPPEEEPPAAPAFEDDDVTHCHRCGSFIGDAIGSSMLCDACRGD